MDKETVTENVRQEGSVFVGDIRYIFEVTLYKSNVLLNKHIYKVSFFTYIFYFIGIKYQALKGCLSYKVQ